MDDRCVCCGTYVPEGRMVCSLCEEKSKEPVIKPKKISVWKKIFAIIFGVLMCLTLAACSSQVSNSNEQIEKANDVVVDIKTPDGSYYSTFSDVEIDYYNDEISNIFINNNTILAFSVSDNYDGGVYIIQGKDFDKIKSNMELAKEYLKNNNIETAQRLIDEATNLTEQYFVYDYCPT